MTGRITFLLSLTGLLLFSSNTTRAAIITECVHWIPLAGFDSSVLNFCTIEILEEPIILGVDRGRVTGNWQGWVFDQQGNPLALGGTDSDVDEDEYPQFIDPSTQYTWFSVAAESIANVRWNGQDVIWDPYIWEGIFEAREFPSSSWFEGAPRDSGQAQFEGFDPL
ncbi:MAG: hypothetical protein RQ757_12380 [Pseudomonadales bacterium]|nr:hypothetical protein [Pseudomonadales bacterium]